MNLSGLRGLLNDVFGKDILAGIFLPEKQWQRFARIVNDLLCSALTPLQYKILVHCYFLEGLSGEKQTHFQTIVSAGSQYTSYEYVEEVPRCHIRRPEPRPITQAKNHFSDDLSKSGLMKFKS